jgi:long-chain-fatty-acid--CoA ligase ACSBG
LDQLPEVKAIVAWLVDKIPEELASDKRLFTWKDFLETGKSIDDKVTDAIMSDQRPGKCCCLIYTSGTTGNPKGVMLSHDNCIYNSTVVTEDLTRDMNNVDNI